MQIRSTNRASSVDEIRRSVLSFVELERLLNSRYPSPRGCSRLVGQSDAAQQSECRMDVSRRASISESKAPIEVAEIATMALWTFGELCACPERFREGHRNDSIDIHTAAGLGRTIRQAWNRM